MPQKDLGSAFKMFDEPDYKLEKNFHEPYHTWKADPTPENADLVLNAVQPITDKAVRQFVGLNPSPTIRSKAKTMALKALQSYDPTRAQLNTHLLNQLQGLRRANVHEQRMMAVPEQVALDWKHLYDAETEHKGEIGSEPSDMELADKTGLSLKRIKYVRQMKPSIAEGVYMQPTSEDEVFSPAVQGAREPSDRAWVDFVYHDLPPIDQKILEHSLGLHGKPKLTNQDIAHKLGISPAAISQRRTKIQAMLDRQEELGLF